MQLAEYFEELVEVAYDKFEEILTEEPTEEAAELFSDLDPLTLEWS